MYMNQFDGAPLDHAFSIMGTAVKETSKQVDQGQPPRDDKPNELNRVNFQENLKQVVERYDKVINELIDEINGMKQVLVKQSTPKKPVVEGMKLPSEPFLNERQINDLIFYIVIGLLLICSMNTFLK
jgi:hypothetical protein